MSMFSSFGTSASFLHSGGTSNNNKNKTSKVIDARFNNVTVEDILVVKGHIITPELAAIQEELKRLASENAELRAKIEILMTKATTRPEARSEDET